MTKQPHNKEYQGVIMVRGKGTGFVSLPNFEDDILIEKENLNTALDGDVVKIELGIRARGRQTGAVAAVLERSRTEFIGSIIKKEDTFWLMPDNRRIHTKFALTNADETHIGMKVAVALKEWKNPNTEPIGEIIEVLGPTGNHETEMRAILRGGGFATNFSKDVQEAAELLHKNKEQIFADALNDPKRRDMRDVTTFTIDPADAKDFDDAISCRELENGAYEVGIHIADVSHYVQPNDPIDKEAQERGTSIYMVDRVIPMLPEILSNDLCSLRPEEDRLAFSIVFEMSKNGDIQKEWYGQTVIHSDKRFSYEDAQKILDDKNGEFLTELTVLMDIARQLREKRHDAGAIAFEQPEVRFELDAHGKPLRAYVKERTETMLMIEDFMLLANRKVAEHIYHLSKSSGKNAAFVYRVHDAPNPDKIEELSIFIHALGYEFRTHKGIVEATDINKLLKEVEGTPEENLIKTATIRSMAKAVYTTKNIGHFGLAFKFYTHFTSPIRRYPDLMAHRLLRRHLDGSPISGKELATFEQLSVQSSERELGAVEAERDSIKYKQVEFMEDKVGQEFDAVISGVTDWGIYVMEKESQAEGLIRLASMKSDYFTHEAKKYRVRGEKTKKTYQLGDEIRVELLAADREERTLDFELSKNKIADA